MTSPTAGRSRLTRLFTWSIGIGTLLVVLLCAGLQASVWVTNRNQDRAGRADARRSAERARTLLTTAAADGELTDAEIRSAADRSRGRVMTVTRASDRISLVLEVRGVRPGMFGNGLMRRCYRYVDRAEGGSVTMNELDTCPTG